MDNDIIIVDYKSKTKSMCKEMNLQCDDINSLIMFLNYCFTAKNNFFIENFNKAMIKNVYHVYNKMKTNIFTESNNLYDGLSSSDIKLLKFIMSNFSTNYKNVQDVDIKKYITESQIKNIIMSLHESLKDNK